ncbi:MAG: aspartyl/asparaginyl beta-hydroxylase domain-containing protein [Gammaproteobacteria bacterium]
MKEGSSGIAKIAREAVRAGKLPDAANLYRQLLEIEPEHIGALTFLSFMAKESGDFKTSNDLLQRALLVEPDNALLWRNLGILESGMDEYDSARSSFEKAVTLDSRSALNHLYLAETIEELGQLETATQHYLSAMAGEPTLAENVENPEIKRLIRRAKQARSKLHLSYHQEVLAGLEQEYPDKDLVRVHDFVAKHHGQTPVEYAHPLQRPAFQYFPGLLPKPWFEAQEFEWAQRTAEKTAAVRQELLAVIDDEQVLSPYVAHQGKVPNAWRKLTNSLNWSAYHIYKEGEKVVPHCQQCPETADMLANLPLVTMPGQAPEAFFSILRPGTHIPPHFGLANLKLAVHLPLVIPDNCAIRVGEETRKWEPGSCLVFDDSFEHEAWNKSEESRAVLIFEVWNPQLTEIERDAVAKLTAATVRFHDFCQKSSAIQ